MGHGLWLASSTMAWSSKNRSGRSGSGSSTLSRFWLDKSSPPETLQILSFETARTMSRLLALYNLLSDDEFSKLRNGVMKSRGVSYLNSDDETFLLQLACDEKLEELNTAATVVARLGRKSQDEGLKHFDLVFSNLKLGIVTVQKEHYNSKDAQKIVEKMEKYVSATSNLHAALESLAEMEASERKLKLWKLNLDPKLPQKTNHAYFDEKLAFQRKQVKHYRETSLWNATHDKTATLMTRIICIIFSRICQLFGPFVPSLPRPPKEKNPGQNSGSKQKHHHHHHQEHRRLKIHPELDYCLIADKHKYIQLRSSKSGPIPKSSLESGLIRFFSQEFFSGEVEKKQRLAQTAPPSTVGGIGLALRYANIIVMAERYLHSPTKINDDARAFMYDMLPMRLKETIGGRLKKRWIGEDEEENMKDGYALAEGWREALEEIFWWLGPMAHDTVQWQAERNMEKQKFDTRPTVLLLQTLFFSDLEKTEAAIVEVLVGLSCIYRYENRRSGSGGTGGVKADAGFSHCSSI